MSPTKPTQTTEAILNGQVVKPFSRIEVISPAKAAKWLDEANVRNRDLRETRVIHLVESLKRGEWRLTGDAIVFDLDGILLNGQHRLAACVIAELPIEVLVLRNVLRASQDVMDDTLPRRLGDALKLRGERDVFRLGAGVGWYARMIYAEAYGTPHYADNARRPSIPQLLALFDENEGLRDCLSLSRPVMHAVKLRPGPSLAAYYRLSLINDEETALFFDKLRSGADLPEGSPLLALRRYSEGEIQGRGRSRTNGDFRWVAVTFKAWNAWRDGRDIKLLAYSFTPLTRETWPEPR
jgi:hypothetical protein